LEPYLKQSSYDITALPLVVPVGNTEPAEEDIEEERNEDSDQEANEKMTIATNKTTGVQLAPTP
jgi:hypothetical protein